MRHHRVLTAALLLLAATPASAGGDCGDPFTPIARIQGEGERSPLVGQPVTVEGVMTLDARGDGGLQGFYLQQSEAEADDNPRTSEALFVYTRRPGGQPGTRLRLTGEVREYRGLTELANVQTLILCGPAPLPEPLPLELSAGPIWNPWKTCGWRCPPPPRSWTATTWPATANWNWPPQTR